MHTAFIKKGNFNSSTGTEKFPKGVPILPIQEKKWILEKMQLAL
jgi:hypothetical protein